MLRLPLKYIILLFGFFFAVNSFAAKTTVLLDCSGSINGATGSRSISSSEKIAAELKIIFAKCENDTIILIRFTDKILDKQTFLGSDQDRISGIIGSLTYPSNCNTDISVSLSGANWTECDRVILITDGLHNAGSMSAEAVSRQISEVGTQLQGECYALLLDETDLNNPIFRIISKDQHVQVVKTLAGIGQIDIRLENQSVEDSLTLANAEQVDSERELTSFKHSAIPYFRILLWILLAILLFALIYLLIKVFPLISINSAGAIQSSISFLYSLPHSLFSLIFRFLPNNMKTFLHENMPNYCDYKRGVVRADESNKDLLEDFKRITGKKLRYKNGEPDFGPASEYTVKLKGLLDSKIPRSTEPRTKVHVAQEYAGNQMLKSRKGRKIIARYVGKDSGNLTFDDYTSWKDDILNIGKPNHNPKTPHETIDGKRIMYVPKRIHDVKEGGIHHSGGVSLLKSIRRAFELNI